MRIDVFDNEKIIAHRRMMALRRMRKQRKTAHAENSKQPHRDVVNALAVRALEQQLVA